MTAMDGGFDLAKASDFRVGGLEVRPPTREVLAADGTTLLEPRIMQVLVALARRRGEVVSRSELIESCWAGRAVGDDAINRCIQAIRRLADEHGGFSIRTVARVGYRLEEAKEDRECPATGPAAAAPAQDSPALVQIPQASERRHLTILSCGLIREAAAGLDPEANYAAAAAWREMAMAAASRFGGHVDSARGDHMLILFGYPEAYEDAAERAVRTGLAIVEQMAPLNARLHEEHKIRLSVRIGIDAGTTVVARGSDGGVELFGEAVDIAGRIEHAAAADAVTISDAVLELVAGQIVIEPQERIDLGSSGRKLILHRVQSAGLVGERRRRGETAFIGRDDELALLARRWSRVRQGAGQLVLIHGEPGIGKSRLVAEFQERIAGDPHLWIECRGEPLFANTALHASSQMLWHGLGWRGDESPEERTVALERSLERSGLKSAEAVPLVAEMLGLPVPDHFPPLMLAPEQRRRKLLATLTEWMFSATRNQPLVLVIEDLHWLDPSSLELLHRLAEQGAGAPLLLLCTARPEFRPSWPARSHHLQLALGGLGLAEMHRLVTGLTGEKPLDIGAVDGIINRADGIPLFAEELTRLVGELGGATRIPATLMDSLAARLDRLGEARGVAQIGAVIGRAFSWELLRQLSSEPDEALQAALERLADAGLINGHGSTPDAHYRFRHALIRDAAYGLLLTGQRRTLHRQIAEAIAAGLADAKPEELAYHWTQAAEPDLAIAAWSNAGAAAYARHAFVEAASAYRQALEILESLPDTAARDARELELSAALSLALIPTEGAQAAEVETIAARTQVLAQRSGDLRVLVTARTYAFLAATIKSEWAQAARLADQVTALVDHAGAGARPEVLAFGHAMSHFCHFTTAFYSGDLAEADRHFEAWDRLNRDRQYEEHALITMAFGNGSLLAWHRGNGDEADRRLANGKNHALDFGTPFDQCACLMIESLLNIYRRDPAAVEITSAEALAQARQSGFAQLEGWSGAALGWAQAQLGAPTEGAALIRTSLSVLAKCETRLTLPWFLTMLGEAEALADDETDALQHFAEALTLCPTEWQYRPYTLVCRGDHRAQRGDVGAAEKDFREAIALAETMGSTGLKLRAMTGLARLHDGSDMRLRLTAMLDGIVGGGASRDMIEARALTGGGSAT